MLPVRCVTFVFLWFNAAWQKRRMFSCVVTICAVVPIFLPPDLWGEPDRPKQLTQDASQAPYSCTRTLVSHDMLWRSMRIGHVEFRVHDVTILAPYDHTPSRLTMPDSAAQPRCCRAWLRSGQMHGRVTRGPVVRQCVRSVSASFNWR
ncbi:hypothetical protein RvY_10388 [Ramazzottius varieornatus]|uniref:Uncharacterized protein n=1 Tax=Ramazzottius varieornatus TaxID=947166 RepID=A0A1D1VH28_RAMVA|nr:hypothetical protein RvY_10388 [Ramazzottius varieornatus]